MCHLIMPGAFARCMRNSVLAASLYYTLRGIGALVLGNQGIRTSLVRPRMVPVTDSEQCFLLAVLSEWEFTYQ